MTRNALIVFVRKPELGRVKTRLAQQIGAEKALAVYNQLLQHTFKVAAPLPCDKYTFVTEQNGTPFWKGFFLEQQQGPDLGMRMQQAFTRLFEKGYQKIVIIGSDCPHLTTALLHDAFAALTRHRVVIGPATDGGYYLLGLTELYPALFCNKAWSTATVLRDTMADLKTARLQPFLLPVLSDVDEKKDVPAHWL